MNIMEFDCLFMVWWCCNSGSHFAGVVEMAQVGCHPGATGANVNGGHTDWDLNWEYGDWSKQRIQQLWPRHGIQARGQIDPGRGYSDGDLHRIQWLWSVQDTVTVICTGYSDCDLYRIQWLWYKQGIQWLICTGYSDCNLHRIQWLWSKQGIQWLWCRGWGGGGGGAVSCCHKRQFGC